MAAKSHFLCNEAIIRSLYNAGHQITFISPFVNEDSLKNYTSINSNSNTFIYIGQNSLEEVRNLSNYELFNAMINLDENYCHDILKHEEVQDMLNSKKKLFDVMFIELFIMFECFLPLAEKLDIPVIGTVTLRSWIEADRLIGNPHNPAIIPFELTTSMNALTFYERLMNMWDYLLVDWYRYFIIQPKLNTIYEQYYPPHLLHKKKISLIFNNNHPSLLPRPMVPNAIDIGGIHLKSPDPLPQDLQQFMDESENGVILLSFGSILKNSLMKPEITNAFKNAFSEIPQRVIWKYENKIENLSDNVRLMNWVPQRSILAHRNVKTFISHCGISGTYEAVYEGVPMVLTPLFGDQISNGGVLHKLGVGVYLNIDSITKESVLNSLHAIINDTRYHDNMKILSKIFRDRPITAQQSVVYWTEYVIRYKGALHLRSNAADMPLYQYFLLDYPLYFILFTFFLRTDAANILAIYPLEAKSHFGFHETMLKYLILAGHRVTMIAPFLPSEPAENFTIIDSKLDIHADRSPLSRHDFKTMHWFSLLYVTSLMFEKTCYEFMQLKEIRNILNSKQKKYDVLFLEFMPFYECYIPIAEKLNIPVIGTLPVRSYYLADLPMGIPRNPAVIVNELASFKKKMTFFQRLNNTYRTILLYAFDYFVTLPKLEKFYQRFFPNSTLDNLKKVSVVFINNHVIMLPRVQGPNVVDIGGLHVKPIKSKSLTPKIKKFIDESEHGVILLSFGSITLSNSVGEDFRIILKEVFAQIPQRVIWKFDEDIEGISENVMLMNWVPQKEILAHKNVVAFISHCGLAGTYEGIYSAKPMIMLPFFGDQHVNAATLNELNIGILLDIGSLTKYKLLDAINAVVNNKSYADRARELSQMLKDNPLTPQEKVVYWTEYVLRHKGALHLRTTDADMPLYQYLLLDVILFSLKRILFGYESKSIRKVKPFLEKIHLQRKRPINSKDTLDVLGFNDFVTKDRAKEKFLFLLFLFNFTNGANIFAIFPLKIRSHFFFENAILKTLASAGHHITVVTPFTSIKSFDNYTIIELHESESNSIEKLQTVVDIKNISWFKMIYTSVKFMELTCHTVTKLKEIQDILKSKRKHYDVMFVPVNHIFDCFVPIAEKLAIPIIGIHPMRSRYYADVTIGNPRNPAVLPFDFIHNSKTTTFLQRLKNTFAQVTNEVLVEFYISLKVKAFIREYYPDFNLQKIPQFSLIFFNGHASILPRALVTNSIDIGGIHIFRSLNPLPQDIVRFLNQSRQGVILLTFGSLVRSNIVNEKMKKIFKETFAEIPQAVIWKFEEQVEGLSDNVMVSSWVPQREILAHKNVKAFITHCGGLGMQEAIYEGKPLIMIPFFSDQPNNAALMSEYGVGIRLDHETLTKQNLLKAIDAVINDESYLRKMQKLSRAYKDRPMTPQENVIYWTEYIIKHKGAPHLRTVAADIPTYQYLLLDVILLATVVKWIICCLLLFVSVESANILAIVPFPISSIFNFHKAIFTSLSNAGHHVTFFTPFADVKFPFNCTVIDTRSDNIKKVKYVDLDLKNLPWLQYFQSIINLSEYPCYDFMKLKETQDVLNRTRKKYDVMFIILTRFHECFLQIAKELEIPVIGTMTFRTYPLSDYRMGNPHHPAVVPFEFLNLPKSMTFFQRLSSTASQLYFDILSVYFSNSKLDKFFNNYHPSSDWRNIKWSVSLLFFNSHQSILARPLVPNVVEIGGIHISPNASSLPKDIQTFIDDSKNDVILFTFGSTTKGKTVNLEMRNAFKNAFAELQERVIWKFDDKIDGVTDNVMVSNWLPQRDILGPHKKVKLFISHCGAYGMQEAVYEGKPMIMIPLFADQPGNAALIAEKGAGIYLDFRTISKEIIVNAIRTILGDTSLSNAGHHVTFFTPFADVKFPFNCTVIDTRSDNIKKVKYVDLDLKNLPWLQYFQSIINLSEYPCYDFMKLKETQDVLNRKKKRYDVMFIILTHFHECFLQIAKELQIPVIGTMTVRTYPLSDYRMGNPHHPAVVPFEFLNLPKSMTFFQRLSSTASQLYFDILSVYFSNSKLDKFFNNYHPSSDWRNIKWSVSLLFFNSHQSILARPLVPNVVEIGGIHISPNASSLPKDIQTFIDDSKNDVILFTFGSTTKGKTVNLEMRNAFKNAFAELQERVIWKFDDKIDGVTDNVMVSNWLPQRDILGPHKKVKLFISHCGAYGMQEAVYEGKPMIMIPLFADQPGNAALIAEKGAGIYLDFRTISKEIIVNAIRTILGDTRYEERMQELSRTFKDRPLSPQESVVYWTEYVIRHGGAPHLRTTAIDMPFYQYFLIDSNFKKFGRCWSSDAKFPFNCTVVETRLRDADKSSYQDLDLKNLSWYRYHKALLNLLENLYYNIMKLKDIQIPHKYVKLFITHCGASGMQEGIYEGKPMIMVTLFLDQPGNAGYIIEKGASIYLDFRT
ncbi:hypothetical protein PGB90_003645 [Kerria lacca]